MSLDTRIGEIAGTIYRLTRNNDAISQTELTLKVAEPCELILLALGWLAREGQVEIFEEKKCLMVRLKKPCEAESH